MIDGKNFLDQRIKNNKVTYENMRKTVCQTISTLKIITK